MALNSQAYRSPRPIAWTARRWARENLFGSVANTTLTVVSTAVIAFALFAVVRFVFVSADWEVVSVNRRLFFLGRFPSDETWRVWEVLFMVSGLGGLSWGLWGSVGWRLVAALAIALVPVFLFVGAGEVAQLTVGAVGLFALAYLAGHTWLARSSYIGLARNVAVTAWLLSFPATMYLLNSVDSLLWGGLLLTMILTVVGIVASFPIGVLLALGRASTFPVIRLFCIGYIELIRGVPLITILFMAKFILPLLVERERSVSLFGLDVPITGFETDDVVRVMAAITLFSAAYLAEIIRGGLQAVPRGQVEAAQALGLSTVRILGFIVLPQALRAVIPAIVGQFISLFKDTSLVTIVGLTELLSAARQVTAQEDFIGRQAEALLFIALIYWVVAFSMSRASQQLERNLGVGER
jgi:general L-amino acid transport system permease protein